MQLQRDRSVRQHLPQRVDGAVMRQCRTGIRVGVEAGRIGIAVLASPCGRLRQVVILPRCPVALAFSDHRHVLSGAVPSAVLLR